MKKSVFLVVVVLLLCCSGRGFAQVDVEPLDVQGLSPEYKSMKYAEYMQAGMEAAKRNRFQEALKNFHNAVQMKETYEVWIAIGDVYDRLGESKKAADNYQRAANILERSKAGDIFQGEKLRSKVAIAEPFASSRNNAFNSLVHVPSLIAARTLPEKTLYLRGGIEVAQADYEEPGEGGTNNYNARLYEPFFEGRYGVTHNIEIGAKLTLGFLSEIDTDIFIYEDNLQIVPEGSRSIGPSDIYLMAKWQPWRGLDEYTGMAIATSIKVPIARDKDFLTSGTVDWGVTVAYTKKLGDVVLHSNIGYTLLFRNQSVMAANVDFNDIVSGGFGFTYFLKDNMSLIFQVEGNTSPFSSEISTLKATPVTAIIGTKYKLQEDFILEMGLGVGFGKLSADVLGIFAVGKQF